MTKVLFCELSGSLVVSNAHLNSAICALGVPQIYLLSPKTAVAFVDDDERAASIIRKGTQMFSSMRQRKKSYRNTSKSTECRGYQIGRRCSGILSC